MKTTVLFVVLVVLTACAAQDTPGAPHQGDAPATQAAATPMAGPAAAGTRATATGTVESIDAAAGKIVITHGPIAAVGWPAMTMGFTATAEQMQAVKVGERVEFEFDLTGSAANLTRIGPSR